MKKGQKIKLIFSLSLLFLVLGASFVFALEIDYPRVPGAVPPQDFGAAPAEEIPSLYVKYIINLIIWTTGIIALGALIYGGIRYLTSAGKPEAIVSAKNQTIAAFFGLLLLLSSFLILKTLSPQFIILKIPEIEPIEVVERPEISPPPTEEFRSSINTEIPFGKIIEENVFEGTIPWKEEKRIPIIYNNARITEELNDKLKEQSEDLYNYSQECTCRSTDPETPCGNNQSGDTAWKCDCGSCSETEPCTCDPCKEVREDIQETEDKNLEVISSGTEISYTNKSKEEITVTTSLTAEQLKTEEEIRLLKKEIDKLERAEKFMLECYGWLDSLAALLTKKDYFDAEGDKLTAIKFWNEILIKGDWATFYCPVSGTLFGETEYVDISSEIMAEIEESPATEEMGVEESPACTTEIPVGEIIDRAKRVGHKLVERMEELVGLDKKLIKAVDGLQVLISQCSSQRGCERRCTCFDCLPQCIVCDASGCHCREGCEGWIYCCADSSPNYPGECKDRDEDTPCPYKEIEDKIKEIRDTSQRINEVIEGKENGEETSEETPEEKLENIGIVSIIEEVIPKIFEDLEVKIRKEMRYCVTDIPLKETEIPDLIITLFTCGSAERAVGPNAPGGDIIQKCCFEEEPFQSCLGKCYLAKGHKEYKKCLYKCIETLPEPENLNKCRHKLNFYCCQF